ncbi:pilus assembly protein [Blastococcus sp. TML/M2B]|uniref:TadE/TadG family type IV pilus assembly protein n=1 Tax=Blastococcus sp. TML/C7B TaxID=2798728 RepID=UPI00190C19EE|nr:TadE/TadG family type IV pilus assembly protein [Blastococcus sp. TML/C7B]MBN1092282.1 pilus assembly protein [Blastococcus sp. TML/M2B]MBN1097620.1 pilus assembly protein [Blastococcus sp. TML/C7B]
MLGERGAAAVEFALVAPVLLLLLFGIIEFSKAFNNQATLSSAAREGARSMALGHTVAEARAAVRATLPAGFTLPDSQITMSLPSCTTATGTNPTVTVTVRYRQNVVAGLVRGAGFDLTGKAAMRCGG